MMDRFTDDHWLRRVLVDSRGVFILGAGDTQTPIPGSDPSVAGMYPGAGRALPFLTAGNVESSHIRELPDAGSARERYEACQPFRHLIVDDFFEPDFALRLHEKMPSLGMIGRAAAVALGARSYATHNQRYDQMFVDAFEELAAPRIVSWLEKVTSISGLRLDDTNIGAGIHQGLNGSALPVHADHNTHIGDAARYRRINIMVYLNPDWRAGWGGHLELYDRTGSFSVDRIEPRFNRAVVLEVHDTAFHGYRALRMPRGQSRQALAAYYYSPARSLQQTAEPHATIFAHPKDISAVDSLLIRVRRVILHRLLPGIHGLRPPEKK